MSEYDVVIMRTHIFHNARGVKVEREWRELDKKARTYLQVRGQGEEVAGDCGILVQELCMCERRRKGREVEYEHIVLEEDENTCRGTQKSIVVRKKS